MKKIFFSLLIIIIFSMKNICAETKLPNGAVKGLPQNLIVLDEDGNSPQDGELYTYIEDMVPNEVYTKDITLMNARDDAVYSIYMSAEPNYTEGEIDLLSETSCKLWLDDELIFEGRVDGKGTPDMQEDGIDLGGNLNSGETRKLHAEFCWNITDSTEDMINQYSNENKDCYGEVSFKWIFYADIGQISSKSGGSNDGRGGGVIRKKTKTDDDESSAVVSSDDVDDKKSDDKKEDDKKSDDEEEGVISRDIEKALDDGSNIIPGENTNPPENEEQDNETGSDVFDRLANKLPFVPDDVKTGYHSELVLYIKIACGAFGFAVLILAMLVYNCRKLKKLRDKSYE